MTTVGRALLRSGAKGAKWPVGWNSWVARRRHPGNSKLARKISLLSGTRKVGASGSAGVDGFAELCLSRRLPSVIGGLALLCGIATLSLRAYGPCSGNPQARCEAEVPLKQRDEAKALVDRMQRVFVDSLESIKMPETGEDSRGKFKPVSWLRNGGKNGGGTRYQVMDTSIFARASVNVSQVHYDDSPDSPVSSATALSVILHPHNPYAPSMHFHISWTELRDKNGSWRMIADLNPSIRDEADSKAFDSTVQRVLPEPLFSSAKTFGDKYFYIPALKRCRGASHHFVASLDRETMSDQESFELAESLARETIRTYAKLVQKALVEHPEATLSDEDRRKQLDYHSLYLLQVLTLDRGTTYGLLAHDDNDVGTLGSIPNRVDRDLIRSWIPNLDDTPQKKLLEDIVEALPASSPSAVDDDTRKKLAEVIRRFYKSDRAALRYQAEMDMQQWANQLSKVKL